jgi:hypothetical protein
MILGIVATFDAVAAGLDLKQELDPDIRAYEPVDPVFPTHHHETPSAREDHTGHDLFDPNLYRILFPQDKIHSRPWDLLNDITLP